MNKTKSKVLSLILASAMIVSSFSSLNFASAATSRETGTLQDLTNLNSDNELFLLSSDQTAKKIALSSLIGNPSIETYDHDNAGAADYDSYNHVSGDKLVTIDKNGDLTLKKDASGKEVITVTYEVEDYDRDDKEVTVKASKEITIYADKENQLFLGKNQTPASPATNLDEKPDDIPTAAVNEAYLDVALYYAAAETSSPDAALVNTSATASTAIFADYELADITDDYLGFGVLTDGYYAQGTSTAPTSGVHYAPGATLPTLTGNNTTWYFSATQSGTYEAVTNETTAVVDPNKLELKGDKIFKKIAVAGANEVVKNSSNVYVSQPIADAPTADNVVRLFTTFKAEQTSPAKDADLAKTGNDTLKIKLTKNAAASTIAFDSSTTSQKVEVAKKWNADINLTSGDPATPVSGSSWEINKKNGKTYIAASGFDWDDSDFWKNNKNDADVVGSYDEIVTSFSVKVLGGSVGLLNVNGGQSVTVEDGTVGDIKAATVDIQGGSVATIKDRAGTITISEGKVKAIDAEDAAATITGGEVTGNVVVSSLFLDADDDDIDTVIGGNVTAKNNGSNTGITVDSSSDSSVTVKGTLKSEGTGAIEISGENVTLNTIDADYANDITFTDFTGSVKSIQAVTEQVISLENESKVTLSSKLTADTVDVDEDARLEVSEARLGSIEGDGTFAFPAGKLFIEDGVNDDTVLEVTDGLVVGATAFQSYEGAVDGADVTGLGFTLETKSANSSTDKHVIKTVSFAGPKFDKSDLTVVKGQSATVTVANYPAGTSLPAGASIEYTTDVNEDYISVTQEGNTLTIKALDYNTSRSVDNKGTITATVVDEDGNELEDYAEATLNVSVIEKAPSVVTLDTTKPVTVGTGAVYQYIAKSSTGAVLSAASSDTQIATVELFNAADPRGYKFQVKGVAVGTATITTTDANGATATLTVNVTKVEGTLKADTTTYTFAPGKVYDVKFSTTGTTAVPVVTVNGKVVSIAPRGNGVYRVTAQNAGTAFVVATVGNTHVSVKFVVAAGAASAGVTGNNVSILK